MTAFALTFAGAGTPAIARAAPAIERSANDAAARGYRETPHVRNYYRSTRL
jgi:hypothetical protein